MNYKKIFELVIADYIRMEMLLATPTVRVGKYYNNVVICDRGVRLFLIAESYFPFDLKKFERAWTDFDRLIPSRIEEDYTTANLTNEQRVVGKYTAVKLENENSITWIDSKLLTEYGKGVTFKISNVKPERNAVLVFRDEVLIGMILPVKVNN